jgi:hypothetical protein
LQATPDDQARYAAFRIGRDETNFIAGGIARPDYRAYKIKNDHVTGVPAIITCDTDQQAIEAAKTMADGHDIELWDGARFVMGIKADETK